jgi:hypothetical protein
MTIQASPYAAMRSTHSYPQRSAVMKDPTLGILQTVLRLAVFCYIIIYVMFFQKG